MISTRTQPCQVPAHRSRSVALSFAVLALVVCNALPSCGAKETPGPKHVILISLDTLRADHLGAYGNGAQLTPTLDSLAHGGVVFESVLAPAPTTLASHTTMLTGQYPQTHGVPRNGFRVPLDNVTLAERLKEEGFHTTAFIGSFALHNIFGLDQGFEVYDANFSMKAGGGRDQNQRRAQGVTDAALAHLSKVQGEAGRLFCFLHYFDAHLPYEPEPKMAQRFSLDKGVSEITGIQIDSIVRGRHQALLGLKRGDRGFGLGGSVTKGLTAEHLAAADGKAGLPAELLAASLYKAEVATVDAAIANLLAGLDEMGILDDCLIIVTGDHGETFWEHGDFWNHGLWLYQTTTHLPWIMSWKGAPWKPGTRVSEACSTVDLVPTLFGLLNLSLDRVLDGVDVAPAWGTGKFERGPIYAVATQPLDKTLERQTPHWPNANKPHAVRLGPWKLIDSKYNGVQELFHLENDPQERQNLLDGGELSPDAKDAHERLLGLLNGFRDSANPLPAVYYTDRSGESQRKLQGLGYGDKPAGD